MAEKGKDNRGRNLKTGEYYDSKNKCYMFLKILDMLIEPFEKEQKFYLEKCQYFIIHSLTGKSF